MSLEKVVIWLDTNSDPATWRVDVLRKNSAGSYSPLLGSDSVDFPVNVKAFGPFEEDLLIQSLKSAYPGADISLKF